MSGRRDASDGGEDARQPLVSVRNISKAYTIYDGPREIFKEVLLGGVRHDTFWALRDISFDVFEGERVGIVGPNGAGKSTLLSLVTGNLTPTSGEIEVNGEVSAMLSLTSFLNPNETGLGNIRFNLLLKGVHKSDVPRLTEEIVDFAELGAFIHAPVRTYSSGMNARLAFSISTVITPDVLVIDEVLGVGDAYFSAKAMLRMIELCTGGRALLFVSHSTSAIQLICNKAIWLDSGGIRAMGPVDEIVRQYEDDFRREEDERVRSGNIARSRERTGRVRPEEVAVPGVVRMRLTGAGGRLTDTHYVRRLGVVVDGVEREVSLYVDALDADERPSAALDLVHSEWNRVHTRRGKESRALAPSSRPLRGGHVLLRPSASRGEIDVALTIESASIGGSETLALEVADLTTGDWLEIPRVDTRRLEQDWSSTTYRGRIPAPPPAIEAAALEKIVEDSRPDVEIADVALLVDGEQTTGVRERQPFEFVVRLEAHRLVPCVDVWLKIVRTDGVYIFWQSSGQVGQNIDDLEGECDVVFQVDPNIFGAGEYELTVDLGNGFDIEGNFPHTRVYDRRVNALRFTVDREWKILNLGPLNYLFPVDVRRAAVANDLREASRGYSA